MQTVPDPMSPSPPAPEVPATGTSAWLPASIDLATWLSARRNHGCTPAQITAELVEGGWSADDASRCALRSLRSSDRQPVLWFSLCWAAGLTAVGFTTAMHQLLMPFPDRGLAALALTLSVVMAPIAVWCGAVARRSEATSTFAVWSPQRRFWFGTLAACTAVVGLIRLITYVHAVIAALVAATPQPLFARDLAQVAISLGVAVPLFWWSFTQWRRSNVVRSGLAADHDPGDDLSRR